MQLECNSLRIKKKKKNNKMFVIIIDKHVIVFFCKIAVGKNQCRSVILKFIKQSCVCLVEK